MDEISISTRTGQSHTIRRCFELQIVVQDVRKSVTCEKGDPLYHAMRLLSGERHSWLLVINCHVIKITVFQRLVSSPINNWCSLRVKPDHS
jgi:hypothetical protein